MGFFTWAFLLGIKSDRQSHPDAQFHFEHSNDSFLLTELKDFARTGNGTSFKLAIEKIQNDHAAKVCFVSTPEVPSSFETWRTTISIILGKY